MNNEYIDFLNDLTNIERSIFLYCVILDIPPKHAAKYLHLDRQYVINVRGYLLSRKNCMSLKEKILEAFFLDK